MGRGKGLPMEYREGSMIRIEFGAQIGNLICCSGSLFCGPGAIDCWLDNLYYIDL